MVQYAFAKRIDGWFDDAALAAGSIVERLRPSFGCIIRIAEDGESFTIAPTMPSGAKSLDGNMETTALSRLGETVRRFAERLRRPVFAVVELPDSWVMVRRIALAADAETFLDRFVRSQLPSLSPVDPALLWIGTSIGKPVEGRLSVTVAMVQRSKLAPVLGMLNAAGCRKVECVAHHDGKRIAIKAEEASTPPRKSKTLLMSVFFGGVAALFAMSAWSGVAERNASIAASALQARLEKARLIIASGNDNNQPLTGAAERARAELQQAVILSDALDRLAAALPLHTHLTELTFADGTLRLSGFTANLPDVLTAVEEDVLFSDTRSVSASRQDEATGRADFTIETKPAPAGGDTTP